VSIEDKIRDTIIKLTTISEGRDNEEWKKFGSDDYVWNWTGESNFYDGQILALQRILDEKYEVI